MRLSSFVLAAAALAALVSSAAAQTEKKQDAAPQPPVLSEAGRTKEYQDAAPQPLASAPDLKAKYEGYLGKRIADVVANWELRAPKANPAMLAVLQMRGRTPLASQYYVPWVGEFVGKYLENAVLLMQTTDEPELKATVASAVAALIASQDRDGYLGPYAKDERLTVCWDLWGHYHAMTALMLCYERYGDANALEAARRAGMFVEKIFYRKGADGKELGVKDVGSDEVNFAIMTALCQLYRLTGEKHYLDCAYRVLSDLESKGDFYRAGLAGTEFYRTAQPRWESLHTILGLEEFHRITGDETYKRAFLNLWESILKRDVHNNGSFSSGEQAVGSPYRDGAIETCCTVAWIALTVEALRTTADPQCADALENSLYNAVCAYTHPSGSWCAYNTPMNGRREAATQTIAFQARPGQPDLNCCSVNSPRGFAELVNWCVMTGRDEENRPALYLNYYGAGRQTLEFDGRRVALVQKTEYPADGRVTLELGPEDGSEAEFTLYLRVPAWAEGATLTERPDAQPRALASGQFCAIRRAWKLGEPVTLSLPMTLRVERGDGDFADRGCVYYGPLLLAYDQFFNSFEPDAIPTLTPDALLTADVELLRSNPNAERVGFYAPLIFVRLDTGHPDKPLFLTDFAFAGALGESYASWLPFEKLPPPPPACESPKQDAGVAPGALPFTWRKVTGADRFQFQVAVSESPDFEQVLFEAESENGKDAVATPDMTRALEPNKTYYWKIIARNEFGETESRAPGRRFRVDPSLPEFDLEAWRERAAQNKQMRTLIEDPLAGAPNPTVGTARNLADANGEAVAFNGVDSLLTYKLDAFPGAAFDASVEFMLDSPPEKGFAQVISAWHKGNDDPLRVAIDSEGKIYGAVEGPKGGMTLRTKIEPGVWHKLRVVKEERDWTLWLDGEELGAIATDDVMTTDSEMIGLGGNPRYTATPEFLAAKMRNFKFRGRYEK